MLRNFYDLNLDKIINPYIDKCKSEYAKYQLEHIKFYDDYNNFKIKHDFLNEGLNIITHFSNFPIDNSINIKKIIDYGIKGGVFDTNSFIEIYNEILMSLNVYEFISSNCKNYSIFLENTKNLKPLNDLKLRYNEIFDQTFLVRDSASKELFGIRKRIKSAEKDIKKIIIEELHKYNEFLNDKTYYIKNDVYVLPVKTTFKNRIDGIIYDVSDSGETTFIQPNSCLKISTQIYKDRTLEKEEIYKIFKALTNETLIFKNELIENNKIFGELDLLNVKYSFLKDINGCVISTLENSEIKLFKMRHPLINKNKVISNDLFMADEKNQLIISGPNAGGKSVLLKLIGVIVYLNQSIFPVPCDIESKIGFFKHIYTDIGEAQSIEYNLSTFSSHIENIAKFLNKVNKNDLILIDELGTGTDPHDGEALAVSICRYLNNIGCKSIITSHFEGVKQYAYTNKSIICGSMIFDEVNVEPMYKIKLGIPGKSYGVIIAKKYGISDDLILDAENYQKEKNNLSDEYLSIINKKIDETEKLKNELLEKEKELDKKINSYDQRKEQIEKQYEIFNENIDEKQRVIIGNTLEKIKDIKSRLTKSGENSIKLNDLISMQNELEDLLKSDIQCDEEKDIILLEDLKVGDFIKDNFLNIDGKIVSISGNKLNIINDGGRKYTLNLNENIIKITKTTPKKQKNIDAFINIQPLDHELNVIGLHVDEALDKVDKYIDKAVLKGKDKIIIIHGYGTGALRTSIHSYLKKNKKVKSFKLGGQYDGGLGSTIVYLK